MIRREKRSAQLKANVPTSLRETYEQFIANDPRTTLSDYVYDVLQEHAAVRLAKETMLHGHQRGQQ